MRRERWKLLSVLTAQINLLICWIEMRRRTGKSHLKDLKSLMWRRTQTTLTQKRGVNAPAVRPLAIRVNQISGDHSNLTAQVGFIPTWLKKGEPMRGTGR